MVVNISYSHENDRCQQKLIFEKNMHSHYSNNDGHPRASGVQRGDNITARSRRLLCLALRISILHVVSLLAKVVVVKGGNDHNDSLSPPL